MNMPAPGGGISRRRFLRNAGIGTGLFPFLRSGPLEAAQKPPTLILLMQSNGTHQPAFWPVVPPPLPAPGAPSAAPMAAMPAPPVSPPNVALPEPSSRILAPITDDARLRARTTVLKGLVNDAGGSGNGHDMGFAGLYSGYRTTGTHLDPWGTGPSIDQILRGALTFSEPYPTLHCGVLATDIPVFKAHRRSFSYTAAKQQIPTEVDPYRLYARFFGVTSGALSPEDAEAASRHRLAQKKSVLDFARSDLLRLQTRIGGEERARLDAHATALRDMETRLSSTLAPNPNRPPVCAQIRGPEGGLDVWAEDNVPALVTLMFDFVALAISCELVRIVTFQFGHGGEKWYFRWLGIDENSHDDIAHRDNERDPVIADKLIRMNTWYATQVAHLAQALDRLPESEGTALDRSLIVWGNEQATGTHKLNDIPVVLLGTAAGHLPQPGTMVNAGPQDYRRLGTSLLNTMGVPAQGFGESADCGPLVGLPIA